MTTIPNDPVMLLSYLNTQLRDYYSSLEELCQALHLNREDTERRLKAIDYFYSSDYNQFI